MVPHQYHALGLMVSVNDWEKKKILSVTMACWRKYHTFKTFRKNDCETKVPIIYFMNIDEKIDCETKVLIFCVMNIDEKINSSAITSILNILYIICSILLLFIRLV